MSLREIRIAAGQRNSSALQFHFGDRDGLLRALVDRHLPRVLAIQEKLHADLVAEGRQDDLSGLVEVILRPNAEYLRRGPSERAWIKISAGQITRPDVALDVMARHTPPLALQVATAVHRRLTEFLEPEIASERLMAALVAAHHLCADRARLEDAPPSARRRPVVPFDAWLDNLLDMAVGALLATGHGRRARSAGRTPRRDPGAPHA